MARTKGIVAKEKYVRTIEYEDAHIGKTSSGKIYAIFNLNESDERRMLTDDMQDAKHIIDSTQAKEQHTEQGRQRGRRTKGLKQRPSDPEAFKHLSHGGYRQCPPPDCPHKCKHEGEDVRLFWVENALCAYTCKRRETCEHFLEFKKEGKKRIKIMNHEPMQKECQFCKAEIKLQNEEGGVYICGTTYNRIDSEYTRICKPKEFKESKPKSKRRRTK